jgi:hypothetical protein
MKRTVRKLAMGIGLAFLLTEIPGTTAPMLSVVTDAQAVIGHPATPGSVAGVGRRTTRRVIRRSTVYVNTLPRGCARTSVNGVTVWRCGTTYYQPYRGRYVVVYIN